MQKRSRIAYKIITLSLLCLFVGLLTLTLVLEPKFKINGIKAMDVEVLNELTRTVSVYDNEDMLLSKRLNGCGNLFCSIDELPNHVVDAFVAVEDKRFYTHNGLDYKRIAGAIVKDVSSMSFKEGASTITQQLAKNTHLNGQKKLSRKLAEARIARQIERQFTKPQILELYLNSIYFGSNAYGIEEASMVYFNCSASQLTLDQSAMLAGVINSPATYSPKSKKENAIQRRNIILNLMLNQGLITEAQHTSAINTDTEIASNNTPNHFRAYIREAIYEAQQIKNLSGEIRIYTYLDQALQAKTETAISVSSDVLCSAIVLDNESGGIKSYSTNSNSYLKDLKRPPASTIKPALVYAPALESKYSLSSPILDEKTSFGSYKPSNFRDKYYGWVTLKQALAQSLNIPSVKIMEDIGVENCKSFAERMGIEFSPNDNDLALSLGGMTDGINLAKNCGAFCTFARSGSYIEPRFIRKICNESGEVVYSLGGFLGKRVMGEDTAYLVTDALKEAVKSGTAKRLNGLGFEVASKTGTAGTKNGNTDAYCISYTTENTIGVWMGSKSTAKPMSNKILGGGAPLQINKRLLVEAHKSRPADFTRPSSVVELDIDLRAHEKNHQLQLANEDTAKKDRSAELFSAKNYKQLLRNEPQTVEENIPKKNILSLTREFLKKSKIIGKNKKMDK